MDDLCRCEPSQYRSAPHQTEGWIVFHEAAEKVFARIADHAALGRGKHEERVLFDASPLEAPKPPIL